MQIRQLKDIDLSGRSVFLRLDLNVPMNHGKIEDETRIKKALPTIRYVAEHAKRFAIASHLGRPKAQRNPELSLEPVGQRLAELLGKEVVFVDEYVTEPLDRIVSQLSENQFILLENLRFYEGETKNDGDFAKALMSGFDTYVDDAFGAVHRAHASIVAAAECVKPEARAAGFLIEREVSALNDLIKKPQAPFTVVMGGAKVSDKIGVILNLLTSCNNLLIGGAMAYSFLKFKGVNVGSSKIEQDRLDLIESIFRNARERNVRILLPQDHLGATQFDEHADAIEIKDPELPSGVMGLDIGAKTIAEYSRVIQASGTVLWNGPMGVFEWNQFAQGTLAIAKAMAETHAKTVVGGGDSVSAINKAGVADQITHISTGGGASLEFLEGKTLPGLKILYQ